MDSQEEFTVPSMAWNFLLAQADAQVWRIGPDLGTFHFRVASGESAGIDA